MAQKPEKPASDVLLASIIEAIAEYSANNADSTAREVVVALKRVLARAIRRTEQASRRAPAPAVFGSGDGLAAFRGLPAGRTARAAVLAQLEEGRAQERLAALPQGRGRERGTIPREHNPALGLRRPQEPDPRFRPSRRRNLPTFTAF
jgi:hypothetical protein